MTPILVLLAALLLLSGFFSASEAALFSLTPLERKAARTSTREILTEPRKLLATVLLANLVVNTLYFAFSARLVVAEPEGAAGGGRLLVGLASLIGLLLFGEILPKLLALRARVTMSRLASPLLRVLVVFLRPASRPLLWVLEALHRGPLSWVRNEGAITPEVLARVLERGAADGALHEREADFLSGILELEDIRVREIMHPRVDTLFLDVSGEDRQRVLEEALKARLTWLPVIDGEPDRVVGRASVRDLVRAPERPIRRHVTPVKFVPEVATVLDVLRTLHEEGASEAVVVDEWGGTAGVVTAEEAFESFLGDLRSEGEPPGPQVVPLGEGRFRVPGSLPIREWNQAFGLRVVPTEFETVGGFVTALLGRIPRAHDTVRVGALELRVHEVRRRRVVTVDIGVRGSPAEGEKEGAA